jgi:hypothetical protein
VLRLEFDPLPAAIQDHAHPALIKDVVNEANVNILTSLLFLKKRTQKEKIDATEHRTQNATLNAAGNATNGKATSSLNGTVTKETFSGTITVNPDCTGTGNFDIFDLSGNLLLTVTKDVAWDDNMRELRLIFTSAVLPDGTSCRSS